MRAGLEPLDAFVVATYLAAVVGLSVVLARRQRTGDDYFLAARRMRGWTLAGSIMANQASAVSLVGAPAFVALAEDGGLRWLQYELALPLAMLALAALLLPALRSVPGSSIYAFAEERFGRPARRVLASAFLLSRGLSLGVILYASSLVAAQALGWPLDAAVILVGVVSVLYTGLGGIVADIWSDVIQLALLWGGTIVSAGYLLEHGGPALWAAIPAERATALVPASAGLSGQTSFGLWPMLVGGFFLYLSYYGCDQSQAQRLLTARSDPDARRALVLNGLLRFPLVATYCTFGLLLAGLLRVDPAFAAAVAGRPPDALVPVFMTAYLPVGLRGLLFAAILAAAMSSIDSALNSLAAVTLEDVFERPSATQRVWLARATSFAWGLFAVASGLAFARSSTGVLELVNQVGSLFYGPVLAVFLLGVLSRRVGGRGAVAGLAGGLLANGAVATLVPGLSWLWWNPIGCAATAAVALAWPTDPARRPAPRARPAAGPGEVLALTGAFAAMLALLAALPRVLGMRGGWVS